VWLHGFSARWHRPPRRGSVGEMVIRGRWILFLQCNHCSTTVPSSYSPTMPTIRGRSVAIGRRPCDSAKLRCPYSYHGRIVQPIGATLPIPDAAHGLGPLAVTCTFCSTPAQLVSFAIPHGRIHAGQRGSGASALARGTGIASRRQAEKLRLSLAPRLVDGGQRSTLASAVIKE